jgi:hypothetical protein
MSGEPSPRRRANAEEPKPSKCQACRRCFGGVVGLVWGWRQSSREVTKPTYSGRVLENSAREHNSCVREMCWSSFERVVLFAEVDGGAASSLCEVRSTGPAERRRASPRSPLPRQSQRDTSRNEEAPARFPQVGDNLWRATQPRIEAGQTALEWGAHRRKAPRVQPIADLFAEDRGQRPFRQRRSRKRASRAEQRRASGVCRWARNGCSKACVHPTAPASPADVVTSSRQEVFERIGSGRSFCREQSRRRAPGERKLVRSLALETSAGLAPQGASPPGKRVRRRWSRRRFGNCFGRARIVSGIPTFNELARAVTAPQAGTQSARSGCVERGSDDRAVVLAGCIDCRSRRAAPGLSPNGGGSSLSPREGRTGVGSRLATAKS